MRSTRLATQYASAERAAEESIRRHADFFQRLPFLRRLVDAVPNVLLILNPQRQIVLANRALFDMLNLPADSAIFGLRPGEALGCVHAFETAGGCGTTEFCRTCGAINAILSSQRGTASIQECHISQQGGDALDLRVSATPIWIDNEQFTVFVVTDIRDEQRRRALERIFFHDILNTAGGLYGFACLFQEATTAEREEIIGEIVELSSRLIDEINAQKELTAAENQELSIYLTRVNSMELLQDIVYLYRNHDVAQDRCLQIDGRAQDVWFVTDSTLLRRVLGNLIKNALEASSSGETVTVGCVARREEVEFWVHNAQFMPRTVQLQMFQRSFSTKGNGRGLGAYSIKLLTERYLDGRVSFTTSPEEGTTFRVCYPWDLEAASVD